MIATPELSAVTLRPAKPEDAAGMLAIFLDRKADSEPGWPEYTAKRIAWFAEHGEDWFRQAALDAQRDPEHHFAQVALVGGELGGFARAESPPNRLHTVWRGLTVKSEYEHQGIGTSLEASRLSWADGNRRPVVARVVEGNDRSFRFLTWEGFVPVFRHRESAEGPIMIVLVIDRLELGWLANKGRSRLPRSGACTSKATGDYLRKRLLQDGFFSEPSG